MGFIDQYRTPSDLPVDLPVFPLAGALLLPRAELPLNIFEPRYLAMVEKAMSGDRLIGMIQPRGSDEAKGKQALMGIGCAGRITSYAETADDRLLITLTGISRFRVVRELDQQTAFRAVEADFSDFAVDLMADYGAADVNRPALVKAFREYLTVNKMSADWEQVDAASTESLVNTLSLIAPYEPKEKQALLEAPDLKSRADVLVALTEISIARTKGGAGPRLQ